MKRVAFLLCIAGVILFPAIYFAIQINWHTDTKTQLAGEELSHYAFYAKKEDYGNLEQKSRFQEIKEKIYGGIVSHHLLAGNQIGTFFAELANRNIKTIVIIGPNHYGIGSANILTSEYSYKTPWGTVEPNLPLIKTLIDQRVVTVDEMPFTKEHSISALVSYVAYHLPEAHLVPIIIKSRTDINSIDALAKSLINVLPEDTVVVVSVDFSHHLNRSTAMFHDDMTVSALQGFDYQRLLNTEVDSPNSLYVLLRYLESRGAQSMHYQRVNAADLMHNLAFNDVTSYVFAHFTKGAPQHPHVVTSLNFGDMMFDRGVKNFMDKGGDPFAQIIGVEHHFLKGADVILGNLEGPITQSANCQKKPYSFKFSPEIAKLLQREGFDAVNLANNHSNDCFRNGYVDTKQYLKDASIDGFGGHNINESYITKKIRETNVVFMGIDETSSSDTDLDIFYKKIAELKKDNEYIVVNIHWGFEYDTKPTARQVTIGHKLIDSGANVIIGHHPHVVQPIEIYKGKAIFYSLGNFIFDQIEPETKQGLGIGSVYKDGHMGFYLFPYEIKSFQPKLLPYDAAEKFCSKMLVGVQTKESCYFEI